MNDRSNEALLARRGLAEKATPGPWQAARMPGEGPIGVWEKNTGCNSLVCGECRPQDAAHIAANSPEVVMADIDEFIRLRAKVPRLNKEADWLATQLANGLIDPELLDHLHELSAGLFHPPTPEMLREAAHKAVEESC